MEGKETFQEYREAEKLTQGNQQEIISSIISNLKGVGDFHIHTRYMDGKRYDVKLTIGQPKIKVNIRFERANSGFYGNIKYPAKVFTNIYFTGEENDVDRATFGKIVSAVNSGV